MRDNKDVLNESDNTESSGNGGVNYTQGKLIIEVLLDIRELIRTKKR